MFGRVAIVNRGEAAMRLIHAARELRAEGAELSTIALYTDVERTSSFVRAADEAYCLGAAADRPYLDQDVLARALRETGADAAWVGWGFVAEDPGFAELCERLGITFIGPSPDAMRALGDKIGAKQRAEQAGVPVAPWSGGPLTGVDVARQVAAEIGYPLMLKATAGGGGRGIRVVRSADELTEAYANTGAEAERAFGSGVMFLESLVSGGRHVEVQVIADGAGTAWALGVRDCSVQRRNQKIIEESASPLLDAGQVAELKAAAERLISAAGYCGAATVEFLYDPHEKRFAFLEVNTRLQVEHPVTEATTGIDLVKAQLHVASGGTLDGKPPVEYGHAVEARLNAEDPDRDFAPAPGRITLLDLPAGPGIRVDTGVAEGDVIPAEFDSMIAKIIAYGRTRDEAFGRLRRAVAGTTVIIEGGVSNKSFLLDLLDAEEVVEASADTGWIDRVRAAGGLISHTHTGIALAAAAIEAYQDAERAERQRLLTTAHGGRPQVQHEVGRAIDLKLRGTSYRVTVAQTGPLRFRVAIEGTESTLDTRLQRYDSVNGRLTVNGHDFRLVTATHGPVHLVEVNGVTHRVSRDEGGVLRSPAPALVVATPLAEGEEVAAGDPVLVLESMKMETVLRAPFDARLRECAVSVGSQVEAGAVLARLEPTGEAAAADGERGSGAAEAVVDLPALSTDLAAGEQAARDLEELRSLLLGFDVDPMDERRALTGYLAARDRLVAEGTDPRPGEVELLGVFADLCELSRNKPVDAEEEADTRVHSPREYFHTYLQSLDTERAGLSETFQKRLTRALAHYGVTDLDRTEALEEAVFRIFLAQRRISSDAGVITAVLRRWHDDPPPGDELRDTAGEALERIITATQLRFPVVCDLARGVVFRWFAQPMLRRGRAEVYARVRGHLRYLEAYPDAPDREERIAEMVASPEPLVRLLGQRIGRQGADLSALLEVLTRRYYRTRGLENVRCQYAVGRPFVTAEYDRNGHRLRLVSTAADFTELERVARAVTSLDDGDGDLAGHVIDIYLRWDDQPEDADAKAAALRGVLGDIPELTKARRVTVSVAGRSGDAMHHHVTFRPSATGLAEERLIRGIHPLIAQRLELQRLRNFDLTRLPSADEDVYLFSCTAPSNPRDQRLVAMAQVRDLTPLRDASGRVVALPAVEGTLAACVDAIRKVQAQRSTKERLDTNRIFIYVWPPSELTAAELDAVAQRAVPGTAGAGIEEVMFLGRQRDAETGEIHDAAIRVTSEPGSGVRLEITEPSFEPIKPLDDYDQKVLRARRRGAAYPYELVDTLAGAAGEFTEYDLDGDRLVPVDRPKGQNTAAIVTGVVSTPTTRHPEGVRRVALLGDPTKALGALAEPECSRVIAALDLAEELDVPVEWFAVSAGAKIAMDSGTENMDAIAAVLERIVRFTQAGREINIVVAGINVGAQPYWNAEATMLMHTKGILVMTPDSAMVLTGKQSLDFSGGVSAEDNFGIGGYDRVMGPNGQAQYWARDLTDAREVLMRHYEHSYIAPGESAPRRASTADPVDRDVTSYPHELAGSDFTTVGDVFSAESNPDRKKAFDIRTVMQALSDADHRMLERWAGMADAETAVVADAHLGGKPVCLIGIESQSVPRRGFPPTDGPDAYTAGTLFPRSSKKVARAINAASGSRPLVVLANLSGFDGSPESMRKLQLEYGAEIGRAIVNFDGPIVFCVISRYHGGAFVVFSKALNPNMTVLAVDGSYASVIGGAPAAAVVFSGEVDSRTAADKRVRDMEARASAATGAERATLTTELAEVRAEVRAEKLGEVAAEFDRIHSIERAVEVGSVDAIIQPGELRPKIIEALERGDAG
ncbi:carboxyl transferase domain-containing protein [Haloechinothrix sp. LS1_15]|uniref:ATP-binding protein n=1 Tax=Haloechinothrix sp. LS1_15 TaxID=2652248 RepID=UPI002945891D|nr:carboxyl transferase domain-containing protein [Haloechinothrix sp. LS1_15]MDV6012651.1 ATP-grasp domain-containing protein [Haloechinothrix sp. LS1_15]